MKTHIPKKAKTSLFATTLTGFILSVSCLISSANAALIPVEDWHDTNGPVGGLLQANFDSSVYFAQAKDIDFSINDTYEMLDGYHLATAAEYETLWDNNVAQNGIPASIALHLNRGGWNGYTSNSGASNHFYFAFADMFDPNLANAAVDAGNPEQHGALTKIVNYAPTLKSSPHFFAGLILIKGDSTTTNTSVPEPSTFATFALGVLGFASRRFKKSLKV